MAVIKADAYGHGAIDVARALHEADAFAVTFVNEAQALRESGIRHPIVALQGFRDRQELMISQRYDIQPILHQQDQIHLLETTRLKSALRVWLKIDTGMHRLGFPPAELNRLYRKLNGLPAVKGHPALLTHLAYADEPVNPCTHQQLVRFNDAVSGLTGERSIANSAAILAFPESHYDWVRPGIMLYGASPFIGGDVKAEGLRPVMTLRAPLIAIRQQHKGDAIGYGGSYICPQNMIIGVVAIGYADGYPRHAPSGTPVLINGQRVSLAGRVSMDMITIDLRGIDQPRLGDEVTLWGQGVTVDEVAHYAGTISYELLCRVSTVRRYLVEGMDPDFLPSGKKSV
jgi:alanine racemase